MTTLPPVASTPSTADLNPAVPSADLPSSSKRATLAGAAALTVASMIDPMLRAQVYAQGSDAPEKKEVKIGFIPLTDCASVVMASQLELDKKYGVKIIPTKEASWASVRDKLVNGEIDFAHVLYGLIYGVQMGIGGAKKDMSALMTLNRNGQGITISKKLAEKGAVDGASLAKLMAAEKREYTAAQTFPTGTHAMWLYYWLASHGLNPIKDLKVITVPPPQMVANMRVGNMDMYCVGEPWNHRAIADGIGVSGATTQDIWKDHPEKVLGATAEFVKKNPNTARAVVSAILEAGKWIDAGLGEQEQDGRYDLAASLCEYTSRDVIIDRILGRYQNGLGKTWDDPNHMKFFDDGAVDLSLTCPMVCGSSPSIVAGACSRRIPTIWRLPSRSMRLTSTSRPPLLQKWPVPKSDMRSSKLMDGVVWDGTKPKEYAASFKVKNA
jgi:nitrate/nitrite transport system substrate-binding protein